MENIMYVSIPIEPRSETSDVKPFEITVSNQSCSPTPFTLRLTSDKNYYTTLLVLSMTDRDFADLKEKVLEADKQRKDLKAKALAALRAELEPDDVDLSADIIDA